MVGYAYLGSNPELARNDSHTDLTNGSALLLMLTLYAQKEEGAQESRAVRMPRLTRMET